MLTQLAPQVYSNILEVLKQHNELSEEHIKLIEVMSLGLSCQAAGVDEARYVYDSDCGLGKTTTLIGLIKAVHQLDLPISILIASAQIEPNCQIVRELIKSGVPESKLGVLHSDPSASVPSINPVQKQKTQFLFVCHARFSYSHDDAEQWMKQHYTWKGQQRSLCIWDEAIQPASAVGISYSDLLQLNSHIDTALEACRMSSDVADTLQGLKQQTDKMMTFITGSLSELAKPGNGVVVSNESLLTSDQQQQLRGLLDSGKYFGTRNMAQKVRATAVLELVGLSCRVISSDTRTLSNGAVDARSCGLTSFFVNVPENLKNIAVLDASFTVNKVIEADTSIIKHPVLSSGMGDRIKRYDNVTIHKMRIGSGKESFQADWATENPVAGTLRAEVVALIASEPDRPTLCTGRVYIPKANGCDNFRDALVRDLKNAGMTDEQIEKNIKTNTWGTHTSSNDYAECSRVVLASVHNLPQLNTAFDVIATAQDLFYDYTKNSPLKDILLGRKVEATHQDVSRGALRQVFIDDNGSTQANPCDIYYPDYNDLESVVSELSQLMPGIGQAKWTPVTKEHKQTQSEIYRTAVSEYLEKLPEFVAEFKTKNLKTALGIGKISSTEAKLFSKACKSSIESSPSWSKKGQTWTRFNDADYWPEEE